MNASKIMCISAEIQRLEAMLCSGLNSDKSLIISTGDSTLAKTTRFLDLYVYYNEAIYSHDTSILVKSVSGTDLYNQERKKWHMRIVFVVGGVVPEYIVFDNDVRMRLSYTPGGWDWGKFLQYHDGRPDKTIFWVKYFSSDALDLTISATGPFTTYQEGDIDHDITDVISATIQFNHQ